MGLPLTTFPFFYRARKPSRCCFFQACSQIARSNHRYSRRTRPSRWAHHTVRENRGIAGSRFRQAPSNICEPLRATEKENVVSVNLSYLGRQLPVERFQKIIQGPKPGKMGDRLIQEVITEHGGLIAIVRCQPAPDGDQVLLLLRTLV